MKKLLLFISLLFILTSCKQDSKNTTKENYFNYATRDDQWTGGIKMIPINTPKGKFKV